MRSFFPTVHIKIDRETMKINRVDYIRRSILRKKKQLLQSSRYTRVQYDVNGKETKGNEDDSLSISTGVIYWK
jgi:hypothetical protein